MTCRPWMLLLLILAPFLVSQSATEAFLPSRVPRVTPSTALAASAGKKKRRRRRKTPTTEDVVKQLPLDDDEEEGEAVDIATEKDFKVDNEPPTGFDFQPPKADAPMIPPEVMAPTLSGGSDEGPIPLPDIRDQLKRKELQQKIAQMEAEEEAKKVKIKRSDREAFTKLLEAQPFADADDSFFEEEAYNTVSALLGERAKPFLGIPTGPLQVGHFIGALGIILMAFVEYPGFPLTNLPTPIRDALAGGLGTVYAINTILAVLAVFKAQERGQPVPFWFAKTFTVGGLAYDQLTQLPTTAEVERAESVKGARALKNRKR